MKRTGFIYRIEADIDLDADDLVSIIVQCDGHYDMRVKELNQIGGTVYGWRNRVNFAENGLIVNVRIDTRTCDLLCKAFERVSTPTAERLGDKFRALLTDMSAEFQRMNP